MVRRIVRVKKIESVSMEMECLLFLLAKEVDAAPRLFLVGGLPRFFAPSFTELLLELSSLSCGLEARDADGVENDESF